MTERPPLVSILLITMNHALFIEEACRSAVAQSWENIEVIFLDNNSTDGTFELGRNILQNSAIKTILLKNDEPMGVAKNLNKMVSYASGEYVAILSGDDWWTADLIEEKVKFIKEKNCDFVLSDGFKYIQDSAKTVSAYSEKKKKMVMHSMSRFFHANVAGNKTVNVGTFIRTQLLNDYPFDEEINTEDWDMNLRMSFLGFKPGFLNKKLFFYRVLSTSLSRNWSVMMDSYDRVTSKYIDYIQSDRKLHKEYLLQKLHFQYEILLSESDSATEKKLLRKEWKKKKYQLKYKQPILFFKLLTL